MYSVYKHYPKSYFHFVGEKEGALVYFICFCSVDICGRPEHKMQTKPSYSLGSRPSSCDISNKQKESDCHHPTEVALDVKSKPVNSSETLTDANILLRCNDLMISERAQNILPMKRMNSGETNKYISDARQILIQNDTELVKKSTASASQLFNLGFHNSQSSNPGSHRGQSQPSSQSSGRQGSQTLRLGGSDHGSLEQRFVLDNQV